MTGLRYERCNRKKAASRKINHDRSRPAILALALGILGNSNGRLARFEILKIDVCRRRVGARSNADLS
jgi:hypothetical protein